MSEAETKTEPQTKTIPLQYPVTVDGREIATLTMRRPKAADQIAMERAGASSAAREVQHFADLCGVKFEVIAALDMNDYDEVQATYVGFRKRASSQTPSAA